MIENYNKLLVCHGLTQIYKLNYNLRSTKITCNHIKILFG